MAARKRGLGKGLDALLSQHNTPEQAAPGSEDELRHLPVDLLQRSAYQPRRNFDQDALRELADSIRAQGIVQPVVVRPLTDSGKYEIIAGERRWRAAQLVGLHEIPAVVRELNEQSAMCLALIENIQRQDLNPLEEARAISRLMQDFDMTHEGVAEAVGRSRSTVTNLMRLLDLHDKVKPLLESGDLEMGHARTLLSLPADRQPEVAGMVVKRGLSVRKTEALVRQLLNASPAKNRPKKRSDPNIERLESDLSERLGSSVRIKHGRAGKGMVQISYSSLDELDGILSRIK